MRLTEQMAEKVGYAGTLHDLDAHTKPSHGGGVYVIQHGEDGPIKLGYTSILSARDRLTALQIGNPTKLFLRMAFCADKKMERLLHKRFSDKRVRGEWFCPSVLPKIKKAFGHLDVIDLIDEVERLRDGHPPDPRRTLAVFKLRSWLAINNKDAIWLAEKTEANKAYLSLVVNGHKKPGVDLAVKIESLTAGDVPLKGWVTPVTIRAEIVAA